MINMEISTKWGGELEHAIECRCEELCSRGDYINEVEDIITRARIGKTWTRNPVKSKNMPNTSREDRIPVLRSQKSIIPKSLKRFSALKRKESLTKILRSLKTHQ
ncbi:hypothetical protein O181_003126 [Austropuccinia psidii MF-1]|uniref:Uncharacterized protein n=1 Tax=Austropuccinia psidii MF-1 TaxID=1389203 RepID=A0A9Q3BD86_9BASI|nr:hypothetical protein [Austropuccinia psidii MF-1]